MFANLATVTKNQLKLEIEAKIGTDISVFLGQTQYHVYVNTDVRKGDERQREKYAGLYVDGGMLNNYPIHAFDNIVSTDCTDDAEGKHLCDLTYYGINGIFSIAGNPRLRNSECDCILGMRLQDFENADFKTEENELYPAEGGVLIDFLKDLYHTLGYGAEEGQIRSLEDEKRTVSFYASIYEDDDLFQNLNKRKYNIGKDDTSYTVELADFSTPAIDRTRGRASLAKVKDFLMVEAGKRLKVFLES